jgi:hypothetical protein
VNRSLVLDGNQIFIVRDSILDMMDVNPVYFSDTKAVLKNIPNGTVIVSKPIPSAYVGMLVKPYQEKEKTDSLKPSKKVN